MHWHHQVTPYESRYRTIEREQILRNKFRWMECKRQMSVNETESVRTTRKRRDLMWLCVRCNIHTHRHSTRSLDVRMWCERTESCKRLKKPRNNEINEQMDVQYKLRRILNYVLCTQKISIFLSPCSPCSFHISLSLDLFHIYIQHLFWWTLPAQCRTTFINRFSWLDRMSTRFILMERDCWNRVKHNPKWRERIEERAKCKISMLEMHPANVNDVFKTKMESISNGLWTG